MFGNDVHPVDVGPLSLADAEQFLRRGFAEYSQIGQELSDAPSAKWIVETVGGWPFYLQVLGHAVVQAVQRGQRLSLVEKRGLGDFTCWETVATC